MTENSFPESKDFNLPAIANEIQEFWKAENIFAKSLAIRKNSPKFVFYEGPPSANGTPGIHHVMARAIKDIFCRFKTQQGFLVDRKAGWDTHGLPVELQVEKELGITKEDIGVKISIEEFNKKCKEAVMRYTDLWNRLTEEMGYWVDMEHPYITYENTYIESLWSLLKQLYDKDLLYKGYTIQPYSPAAGTGLSSHELNQPGTYKQVKDTTIVAQFELNVDSAHYKALFEGTSTPIYALAWTTTPWTLPGNAALAVGKNIEYALVETLQPYLKHHITVLLGKDVLGKYFAAEAEVKSSGDLEYDASKKALPYRILKTLKGAELDGLTFKQLMPYVVPSVPAFRIIIGDFVSTEEGTGIVHIAPTFGADDFRVAKQAGIPPIMVQDAAGKDLPIVDRQGRFVPQITDFAGRYVKNYAGEDETKADYQSTDLQIALMLKEKGLAFRIEKYEHPYPHCWRTDKPILYYPLESWFIKTTAKKDRLIELNKTINWKPQSTGTDRKSVV